LILIVTAPVFGESIGAVFHKDHYYKLDALTIKKGSLKKLEENGVIVFSGDRVSFKKTGIFQTRFFDNQLKNIRVIPGFLSIIPPLLAIGMALIFKETILSLLLGIISGVFILNGYHFFPAIRDTLSDKLVSSIATKDHVSIIIFTVLLGGMVGIIHAGGGTEAVVQFFSKRVRSRKGAMFYSWLTGVIIFFDDYANTLIVGKTMRPITDAFGVSREKLSYIVDSTAAPVTAIAVISTWIGFEISILNDLFHTYGIKLDGYTAFVYSIPYLFYPILTIVFVLFVSLTGKDFGPMFKFEKEAVKKVCSIKRDNSVKGDILLGVLPIVVVIVVTLSGIVLTGLGENTSSIREIFAHSDSFSSLIWGSSAGCLVAGLFALKYLSLNKVIESWLDGLKTMVLAVVILSLAWTLGNICGVLKTGDYVVSVFPESFPLFIHPALAFLVSALISFATGTSWGTMAIGYPLLIPLVFNTPYLFPSIAAILSGAVFGDHCSPISDTTIMSSMSSECNHINHVRTQLPYAITVAAISMVFCYGILFLHLYPFVDIIIGVFVIFLIFRYIAKPVEECYENEGN